MSAARRSDTAVVESLGRGIERCRAGAANGVQHRLQVRNELIGCGRLDYSTGCGDFERVSGISE